MSRRAKVTEWSHRVSRTQGGFQRDSYTDPQGRRQHSLQGFITTPLGYVYAYSAWDEAEPRGDQTRLDFVWQGREHFRSINRAYTEQGLATVAGRFAREIAGSQP